MSETQKPQFSKVVESRLASSEDSRGLWLPVSEEFDRAGPDAAKAYLDAERQRLEQRIQNLLEQVTGG